VKTMNAEQRRKFAAQQTALSRSAAASTKFQIEQANKSKPESESKPEKPVRKRDQF
jgi:hypothetical protein